MINRNLPYRHQFYDINYGARFQHQVKGQMHPLSPAKSPVSRNAQPPTRTPQPAPRTSHRTPRTPQPATHIQLLVSLLVFTLACCLGIEAFASTSETAADLFAADIRKLSSLGDRSTGSRGNEAAAAYIRDRFAALGIETVGSHKFDVAIIKPKNSTLTIPGRGLSIPIRSIRGNAVTPQTIPSPGIKAPLIYVGNGDFYELNGKDIEGSIVLMELDSGKNWLYAADLGAKALIYLDRGNSTKTLFEEKFELSPIQFPRFWMPLDRVQAELFDY